MGDHPAEPGRLGRGGAGAPCTTTGSSVPEGTIAAATVGVAPRTAIVPVVTAQATTRPVLRRQAAGPCPFAAMRAALHENQ